MVPNTVSSASSVALLNADSYVVTVGTDEDNPQPKLKFWNLRKRADDGDPEFTQEIVTALAVAPDASQVAVGLCDGSVLLFIGNLLRGKGRQLTATVEGGSPITGLFYSAEKDGFISLFAVTADAVKSFIVNIKTADIQAKLLDSVGGEMGCSVIDEFGNLAIAKRDGIHFYSPSSKLSSTISTSSSSNTHSHLYYFRPYHVAVEAPASASSSASASEHRHVVTLYQESEKYTGYKGNFMEISQIFYAWGTYYVLGKEGSLFKLVEKPQSQKLDILFRRNLYQIAINMALSNGEGADAISDIYTQYGDNLYSKGDFEGAMTQYINTIGSSVVEPSYVIKKFLENQHNDLLTLYLEKIHEKGFANKNHTTLLLNCYSTKKNYEKINNFILREDISVDVESAINVCREGGYIDTALQLAKLKLNHYWYVKMLLEDFQKPNEALEYIHTLPLNQATNLMLKFGKKIVQETPQEATKFLMELCTDYHQVTGEKLAEEKLESKRPILMSDRAKAQSVSGDQLIVHVNSARNLTSRDPIRRSDPYLLISLGNQEVKIPEQRFTLNPTWNLDVVFTLNELKIDADHVTVMCADGNRKSNGGEGEYMGEISVKAKDLISRRSSTSSASSSVELLMKKWWKLVDEGGVGDVTGEIDIGFSYKHVKTSEGNRAPAEDFISLFSIHPKHLTKFLDFLVSNHLGSEKIFGTLLELYLREDTKEAPEIQQAKKEKARLLLSDPNIKCDLNHALIICQMYNFSEGIIHLYERMSLSSEIAQHHMEKKQYNELISTCRKYGKKNPRLWTQALLYFSDKPSEECAEHIKEVLVNIEQNNILQPIQVLEILSKATTNHPLDIVQGYLLRHLQRAQKKIEEDYVVIKKRIVETAAFQHDIQKLRSEAVVFDRHEGMDLPAVHFLSGHSYSLNELQKESICPATTEEYESLKNRQRLAQSSAQNHAEFFRQLEGSDDGFSVIATFLGRGLFDVLEGTADVAAPQLDPSMFADLGLTAI